MADTVNISGSTSSAGDMLSNHAGLRLAHEAMMMQDAQEVLSQQRAANAAHAVRHGAKLGESMPGDIHIGDIVQQPESQPTSGQARPSSLTRTAAIVLAALAGGGAVASLPAVMDWLRPEPQPATIEQPAEPSQPAIGLSPGGLAIEVVKNGSN